MAEIGEVRLEKDQLNHILAALLTMAALANAPRSPASGTMCFYEEFLKLLNKGPIERAFEDAP